MTTKKQILKALKDFKVVKRGDKSIYTCKDGKLLDLIREAHNGVMPNDWIFEKVHDLMLDATSYDDLEDSKHEIIDTHVDIYNVDLYTWASRFGDYVDQANSEGLTSERSTVIEILQAGQFVQLSEIFDTVIEGLANA